MELTEQPTGRQIAYASDELAKSKLEWFCLECGRPRRKNYCPWNSKHPNEFKHVVSLRRNLTLDLQVRLFLSNRKDVKTRHVFVEG